MPATETKLCIYCSKEKLPSEFSEEHIIPKFMGGSSECPIIVTKDVCQRCNSLFGRFVDAAVAKGYFLNSVENGAWQGCYDFDQKAGNNFALTYFGESQEINFGEDEEVEVWLCPDGGTAWNIHKSRGEDFDALAGGDPVNRRKADDSRVYTFLSSQDVYWAFSSLKSVLRHFEEEPIFLGTETDVEQTLPTKRDRGKLCQKDAKALEERDQIRAVLDRGGMLKHLVKMDLLFDVRFLAKIAIAFGFKFIGSEFRELIYTEQLRNILWTRRADLSPADHQLRMKTYFAGLQDFSLKFLCFPQGFVFLLKPLGNDLILSIAFPSGNSVQVSITDSTIDTNFDLRTRNIEDQIFISIPQLGKTIGPIKLATYLAWKTGSLKNADLDNVTRRFKLRSEMPPLR